MKKTVFLCLITLLVTSCGTSNNKAIKNELKNYVTKRSEGIDVEYKLKSFQIIDTITYGEAVESLRKELPLVGDKITLEEFREQRDREFKEFRASTPNYEEEVMHGELKDASPWCTKIRIMTEKADSLMNVWNDVTTDSYEYNHLIAFYLQRMCQFYDMSEQYEAESILNRIESSKKDFERLDSFAKKNPLEIYSYKIEHDYSIYNPFIKNRVNLKDIVILDKDLKYVSDENMNDFFDFMK